MSCDAPIVCYRSNTVNPKTGKRPMQFRLRGSFSGVRYKIPCGKCLGCKLEHSRRWAVRLVHENKMHKESCFITLTYDNDHLPKFGTLVPRHLQLFHKRLHNRLRDERGYGIRYYGCGEYGSLNMRPHYHSLIFGFDFKDKLLYSRNNRGENIYSSKFLDELWHDVDGSNFGAARIGAVTFESAAYVARYCCKKIDGKLRDEGHYLVYDSDGELFERVREFPHMSRRPGIGSTYFDKYGSEIAQHDNIILNGREVPSVRYYDLKIESLDPARMLVIKKNRRRKAVWLERTPDRMRVKEVLRLKLFKMKERRL